MAEPSEMTRYVAREIARTYGWVEPGTLALRAAERVEARIRADQTERNRDVAVDHGPAAVSGGTRGCGGCREFGGIDRGERE